MTDAKPRPPRTDSSIKPSEVEEISANTPLEDDDLEVAFSSRVIAFLMLIVPFCLLIDRTQVLLLELVSEYVVKMFVLVGLILFLLAVGKLSHWIQIWRDRRRENHTH